MPTTQPTEQTEDKKGEQFRNIIETLRSQLTLRQIMIIQLGYQDALEEARQDGALRERRRRRNQDRKESRIFAKFLKESTQLMDKTLREVKEKYPKMFEDTPEGEDPTTQKEEKT